MKKLTPTIKLLIAISSLYSVNTFAQASCETLSGCAKKQCIITQQIEQAKLHDNQERVKGLTIALNENIAHCTHDDLKQELMRKIEESDKDVVEYKADLETAKLKGKSDKIQKYQEKIIAEEMKRAKFAQELGELQ